MFSKRPSVWPNRVRSASGRPQCPRGALRPRCIGPIMPMKPMPDAFCRQISRWHDVSRIDVQTEPGGALPLVGRRRIRGGRLGKRFQPPKIYGRLGNLEVRLACKKSEIQRAQRLRYKVFYEEMSAIPSALAILSRRDERSRPDLRPSARGRSRRRQRRRRWRQLQGGRHLSSAAPGSRRSL